MAPARRVSWLVLATLVLVCTLAAPPARGDDGGGATPAEAAGVPDGLSSSDWSSIRAAYEAGRHAAFAVEGGWQARNPGQQWRTRFDGRGFVVTPDLPLTGEQPGKGAGVLEDDSAGWPLTRGQTQSFEPQADERSSSPRVKGWSWGLELTAFGRGGEERAVADAPACVEASGQRVEYRWDETLTEWYVNDQRGLEHGYTLHRRPGSSALRAGGKRGPYSPEAEASGNDRAPSGRHEPLQFTLAVRGGLCPNVSIDGRSVTFINDAGAAIVNYSGLTVFDADGVALPAWFAESGNGLILCVDDRGARYPLTIDPVADQAYLKASNTGLSDFFGYSVAVSGDTVVVGAYREASNATGVNGNQADNSAQPCRRGLHLLRSGGVWSAGPLGERHPWLPAFRGAI